MRKIILNIGVILIIGMMLLVLTGCGEENENIINSEVNTENISNNSNKQNIIKNETNSSKNKVHQSSSKNETNEIEETNTSDNEEQSVPENETVETSEKKTTFNVGDNVLHYGNYKGSGNKFIDTKVVSATITINLKEYGTYTYKSTNQDVSKDRSGTYEIKNNYTLVLNDSEPLEYSTLGDDRFIENQGTGFVYTYQGN